jgi:hypothetical protein
MDIAFAIISVKAIKVGWREVQSLGQLLLNKGGNSPRGLIGRNFEQWLVERYGGTGSIKIEGREFDNIVGSRWMEAKSGNYWRDFNYQKFTSDTGAQLKISTKNGGKLEIHSNTPIPLYVKAWLTSKGISFFEYK